MEDALLKLDYSQITAAEAEEYIKNGANVNAVDGEGKTALVLAGEYSSNPEIIRLLVKHGADVNFKNNKRRKIKDNYGKELEVGGKDSGLTPLVFAVRKNTCSAVIKALIDAGADVNQKFINNKTPLMYAAQENTNPDVIKTLADGGARLDARDNYGSGILYFAVLNPEGLRMIKTLVSLGCKVNSKDGALLSAAAKWDKTDVLEYLLDLGLKVNAKDEQGYTPLMTACMANNINTVKLLVERGALLNEKTNKGETALWLAKVSQMHNRKLHVAGEKSGLFMDRPSKKNRHAEVISYLESLGATE